jgi:uncharacterized protein (DUF924 family)
MPPLNFNVKAHKAHPFMPQPVHQNVLVFWFEEISPKSWWVSEPDFDELVLNRFGRLLKAASAGECFAWRESSAGRLAEIIVLDQFSRNIHRGTWRAFAQDPMALALAQEAVAQGILATLSPVECSFLLMPYMHSESRFVHQQAEVLFRVHAPAESHSFELRHKTIVDQFGRYPHRNELLGRESTPEELEFLKQPGSKF